MQYAFMTWSCPDLNLHDVLALAKRYDYDGVEFRIGRGRHFDFETTQKHGVEINTDAQTRAAMRETIKNSGIGACCIATSCVYADPATADKHIDETKESIDLAGDLGITRLRVFGGIIPPGLDRQQAITLVSSSLRAVAEHAQQRQVVVCMETHDDWCDPAHVAKVMQQVDHPAIAVNWDFMHPVHRANTSVAKSYDILKPWIAHVHIHDGIQQGDQLILKTIGQGQIDHRIALELLKADRYDGYLSGEWIQWEPYDTHLPRER